MYLGFKAVGLASTYRVMGLIKPDCNWGYKYPNEGYPNLRPYLQPYLLSRMNLYEFQDNASIDTRKPLGRNEP